MTLPTWPGVTGRNIPTQVSGLTVTRCLRVLRLVFFQKTRLSFFSHWLIMERLQSWPNLGSRISKFRDMHAIDNGMNINRRKFQGGQAFGVAMTSIQTFSEVKSLSLCECCECFDKWPQIHKMRNNRHATWMWIAHECQNNAIHYNTI